MTYKSNSQHQGPIFVRLRIWLEYFTKPEKLNIGKDDLLFTFCCKINVSKWLAEIDTNLHSGGTHERNFTGKQNTSELYVVKHALFKLVRKLVGFYAYSPHPQI